MTDERNPDWFDYLMVAIAAPIALAAGAFVVLLNAVLGLFMGVCALVGHVWHGVEDGVKGVRGK